MGPDGRLEVLPGLIERVDGLVQLVRLRDHIVGDRRHVLCGFVHGRVEASHPLSEQLSHTLVAEHLAGPVALFLCAFLGGLAGRHLCGRDSVQPAEVVFQGCLGVVFPLLGDLLRERAGAVLHLAVKPPRLDGELDHLAREGLQPGRHPRRIDVEVLASVFQTFDLGSRHAGLARQLLQGRHRLGEVAELRDQPRH